MTCLDFLIIFHIFINVTAFTPKTHDMARPKKEKKRIICKNCDIEFEVIPSSKQEFCNKTCAQQYKGKDKSWLKKRESTCLEKYGTKVAFQSEQVQNTYKNNLQEKYGVTNPFLIKEVQDKSRNTIIERYGVEIAAKNKEIGDKISKKLKGRTLPRKNFVEVKWEKLLNYYNISGMKPLFDKEYLDQNMLSHLFKNKFQFQCDKCSSITDVYLSNGYLPSCNCSDYKGYSLVEDELVVFLSEYISMDRILLNRRDILPNRLEIDIYLPDYNLAIEINGVYWHSESMGKYKNYHLYKTDECEKQGIHLIHILDYEWIFKKHIIQSVILNKLNKISSKIYARKCELKKIDDVKIVKQFLNDNHIQGYTHSSINLGLYHNNELVSLMTFSKNRFKKNSNEMEMVRFCNKLNTNITGGASKLFKHFITNYNTSSLPVLSFADRRFFDGNLYKTLGFLFVEKTSPSYIYWKNNIILNRMSCQKHKLSKLLDNFNSNLTEYENMLANGWRRVWDSGNLKWIYK
jgi:hypothetical protein